jgi:outer membrane protein OmpA-like peptidoglycan-associated protein
MPRGFLVSALTAGAVLAAAAGAAEGDAVGGKDYPGLGRFAGSVITGYDAKDFDETVVQAKAFKAGKATDQRRLEGKVTRIAYRAGAGASTLEVFRNYTNKAAAAGFETLLDCETDACGGLDFAYALDALPLPQMWIDGFSYRYYAARKPAGAASPETYVSVATSQNNDDVYTQVTVVELGAVEDKMVDAATMAKSLAAAGHVALYGVYFDTGKAEVRAESAPTLAEIAKLLKSNPELGTVYIVGHTDSQGAFDYNMDLSKRRAAAIAAELAARHGVAEARLKTAGVGFLAPVASNANEAGRVLNRRTELVLP